MAEIHTPTKKNIHASDIAILDKKLPGPPKLLGGFSIFRAISLSFVDFQILAEIPSKRFRNFGQIPPKRF